MIQNKMSELKCLAVELVFMAQNLKNKLNAILILQGMVNDKTEFVCFNNSPFKINMLPLFILEIYCNNGEQVFKTGISSVFLNTIGN